METLSLKDFSPQLSWDVKNDLFPSERAKCIDAILESWCLAVPQANRILAQKSLTDPLATIKGQMKIVLPHEGAK